MSLRSTTAWSAPRVGRQSLRLDEVLRAGQAHALSTGGLEGDGSIVGNKAKPFKQHGGHSFGPGYGAKKKVSPGDLGKQLTACNDEKRRLQKRKDDCEEELARTKAENQRLNEKIAQMTMDAASARQKVQNLGQEKEALRERLMARLARMTEAGAASDDDRARQEAEIRSLLGELRSLDARVVQASQELDDSQAELAGQREAYSQEIQSLEEANAALQVERIELQTHLEELRVNVEVLRNTLRDAERALPDGTSVDVAVQTALNTWDDDEMDDLFTTLQDMSDAALQTNKAVDKAEEEYVQITIKVDALEAENDGVREAYESLQAEVRGLRASIENQIKEGLEKLSKEIKTKQPQAPAQPADADCDRAIANPKSYNGRLYMAIATGDAPSALRLIRSGAILDDSPTDGYYRSGTTTDTNSVYPDLIYDGAASIVLFEDFRWLGRSMLDFSRGKQFGLGDWGPCLTGTKKSVCPSFRYYGEDGRDEANMLQIIDLLANNPCPANPSFRLWIPAFANPINWTPVLVKYAYDKNLMPPETEWSLLNAVYAWAHKSPLKRVVEDYSGDRSWRGQEYRSKLDRQGGFDKSQTPFTRQLQNLSGDAYLKYEEQLLEQTEDMLELARNLGQVSIQPGARNSPSKFGSTIDGRQFSNAGLDPEAPPEYDNHPTWAVRWDLIDGKADTRPVARGNIHADQRYIDKIPPHPLRGLQIETLVLLKERYAFVQQLKEELGV